MLTHRKCIDRSCNFKLVNVNFMNEIDFLKEEEKRNEFLEIDYKFLWKLAYLEIDSYKT